MRRYLTALATLALSLSIGASTAAAQISLPEIPGLPGGIDISDEGVSINVGGVSVSTNTADGTTNVNAGDFSVSTTSDGGTTVTGPGDLNITLPAGDDPATVLPENGTITVGGVSIVTTTVNGATQISLDVAENGTSISCDIALAEGVTLDEFLASLEGISPEDVTLDLSEEALANLVAENDLGSVDCGSD
jgi:hypothetical protein